MKANDINDLIKINNSFKYDKAITVKFNEEQYNKLSECCQALQIPFSTFIRLIVNNYLQIY